MKKIVEKNFLRLILAVLLFSGGLLTGCDPEEPCIPSPGVYKIGFFGIDEAGVRKARSYNFDEVQAIGSDSSFFLRNRNGVSELRLALNPGADTTTYVFRYENGADTLSLSYKRVFNVVSPECGLGVNFSDLNVVAHTFDSLNVLTTEISPYTKGFDLEVFSLGNCVDLSTNRFMAGFFVFDEAGNREARAFNFDTVRAVGRNTLFFRRNEEGTQRLGLSLDPAADATTFLFKYGVTTDTLTVGYQRHIYIGSPDCGLDTLYRNLTIVKNTFDGARILNTELTTDNAGLDIEILNDGACESDATNSLEAGFFVLNGTGEPEPRAFNFDEVRAMESGTVFFTRNQEGTAKLQLALEPAEAQTTFIFSNQQESDTLVVSYEQKEQLYSPECSEDFFYTGLAVTRHTFDSVRLLTKRLSKTTEGLEIEIYP